MFLMLRVRINSDNAMFRKTPLVDTDIRIRIATRTTPHKKESAVLSRDTTTENTAVPL